MAYLGRHSTERPTGEVELIMALREFIGQWVVPPTLQLPEDSLDSMCQDFLHTLQESLSVHPWLYARHSKEVDFADLTARYKPNSLDTYEIDYVVFRCICQALQQHSGELLTDHLEGWVYGPNRIALLVECGRQDQKRAKLI